jgi:hypothetical protein
MAAKQCTYYARLNRQQDRYTALMIIDRNPRRASRALILGLEVGVVLLMPFLLLAVGLVDERLSKNRPVARFYRAIGIWEPLEELHDGLASLFD